MKYVSMFALILTTSILRFDAYGFDIGTHARITRISTSKSGVGSSSVFGDLGISGGTSSTLGSVYFDMRGDAAGRVTARGTFDFDWANFVMPGAMRTPFAPGDPGLKTSVEGWMMRGAIREDDGGFTYGWNNPHDDPQGNLNRFCNHFYDPTNNSKLSTWLCGSSDLTSAPIWALGVPALASPPGGMVRPQPLAPANVSRRNRYTYQDVREAMWRALTLKQFKDQSGALQTEPGPPGPLGASGPFRDLPMPYVPPALGGRSTGPWTTIFSPNSATARKQYRDAYWATAFFSLGSVLHINQDMAQPQHTRVEVHPLGWRKELEAYIEARALSDSVGVSYTTISEGLATPIPLRPLSYSPPAPTVWLPPALANLSDYWSAAPDGNIVDRLGLGDYSNSHFFSPAHNLKEGTYQSPPNTAASYTQELSTDAAGYKHRYLRGTVHDPLYQTDHSIRMTRLTAVGGAMLDLGMEPTQGSFRISYLLDSAILDDYATLLIPRAVSYSAGIINYLFRGKLRISPPDSGIYGIADHARFSPNNPAGYQPTNKDFGFAGFNRIKLKLVNETLPVKPPVGEAENQPMAQGVLVAVLKFHRNLCYDDLLDRWPANAAAALACRSPNEEIVVSAPLIDQTVPAKDPMAQDGSEYTFDFSAQELPINAWDVVLQVVYRGQLGREADAVVVATRDLSEPAFIGFTNTTDRVVLNGAVYTPAAVNADQQLLGKVRPACRRPLPGGGYELWNVCYAFGDYFVFTAGTSDVTISAGGTSWIPPRHFARIALLSDSADGVPLNWSNDTLNCHIFLSNPITTLPYTAQLGADDIFKAGSPMSLRGVNSWNWEFCYADVGTAVTLPQSVPLRDLGDLQSLDERAPVPLTITGW